MATTTELTTAEQLLQMPHQGLRWELVQGELRSMSPAGGEHGVIISKIFWPLSQHVYSQDLGVTCGSETGFILTQNPDTVRAPDIAYVRRDKIPVTGVPKGFWPGAPDLAVEVVSPGDTVYEVDEKIAAWLEAGTTEVWIVNPRRRTVKVHRASGETLTLQFGDYLEGGELLPGFRLHVQEIFS